MDPQLVIFAIESAVKLGRKVYEVLVDETGARPLLLPVGNLFQSVDVTMAVMYFGRKDNKHLITGDGPYADFTDDQLLAAYQSILEIDRRIGGADGNQTEAKQIIAGLGKLQQVKKGFGPKSPAQRILGTVVKIGIDYFSTHPEALGEDSRARQLVSSLIGGLGETDFAEGSFPEIAGDVLRAAFKTLGSNPQLVTDDERLKVLLVGVTGSLAESVDQATSEGAKEFRRDFFKRVGTGIVRGAATAFDNNPDLFLPRLNADEEDPDHPQAVRALVSGTLTQFLAGIKGKEDIFTSESVELLTRSALSAVGENAELLTKNDMLREFVSATSKALTDTQGAKLFSSQTVAVILREGLEVLGENVETLIDPKNPQQQLLASALSAMSNSLASNLAGPGGIKELLSARQLTELTRIVFAEVAAHPEQLLSENLDENKRTVLAQVIASVARALGDEPTRLVNGDSFLELTQIALQVAVKNADQLLDIDTTSPNSNPLFKVLKQTAESVLEGDSRKIVSREVFVELIQRLLPVASANLEPLLAGKPLVAATVATVLELASGPLKTRINGGNLPVLVEELLRQVLPGDLKLTAAAFVEEAAVAILNRA
ncbi:MAG TPA: hypothetical protein PLX89_22040 [Verrucomicrobiota bacterium]|nr:hypothetical protein [Verrucomicrobiales bacterium]HRI15687.1 hypothetical protein [Verrucomicrobiota bacterium]